MSVRTLARVWELSAQAGNDLLMLLAIADFADDDGRAYPSIATLARKCRMTPRNVNLILAELRKTGELVVRQNEGPKGTNLYRVVLPPPLKKPSPPEETFTLKDSSATPEETFPPPLKKPSDEPSVNRQQPSTRSRTQFELTKFDPRSHLAGLDVPAEVIGDWLALRKQQKAPATKTAIDGIEREAKKASIGLADALRTCCERGWRGFNASWMQDKQSPPVQPNDAFKGAI